MSAKKKSGNDRLKITIAEDSPTQAEQLKYILETNGYQVVAAGNGKEALALVRSDRPDIVISDIVMPEMDGYELCKQIKMDEKLKDVPVILLTGLSDPADVIKGLECGADNFVTKPYDERTLLSRIEYLRLNWGLQDTKQVQMGIEITFGRRKYFITSDRLQILNLLLSTYESAVGKNRELEQAQDELRRMNEQLEQRVKERTAELAKANEELNQEITERKQAEEGIIHLNSVLRALRGVNQLITHGPDRERLIQQSCDLTVKTRGFLCAWILLFDEERKYISAAVAGGEETQAFYQQLKQGDYPPCIDRILAQKDSLAVCGDIVENGLDCLPRSLYSGGNGLISRLEYRGKVYGIISTYIQSDYSLDPEEQSLFRELASDIAFGLYDIEKEEERKQAEETIRESEEKYRTLFESSAEGILIADIEANKFKYANPAICTMLGYSQEELTKMSVSDIHSKASLEHVFADFAAQARGEKISSSGLPCLKKDGTIIYADINAAKAIIDGRECNVGFFTDVTERRLVEEKIRQAAEEWRITFDSITDLVSIHNKDFKLVRVNKAFADTLKMKPKELIDKTCYQVIHRTTEPVSSCPHMKTLKTKESARGEFFEPHLGIYLEVATSPIFDDKGEVVASVHVARDITERKKAEEALRQSAENYRGLAESINDVFFAMNNELRYVYWNRASERLTGIAAKDALGKHLSDVFPDVEETKRAEKEYLKAIKTKQPQHFVNEYSFGGKDFVFDITAYPTQAGVSVFVKDITEQNQMQEQMILTDRLASIGQLASGIAHELNNPLTSVIGFSELLLERDLPADVKEDLETINREAKRTANVVKGLLTFVRKQGTEKAPVDINSIIQGVLQLRSYEQGVSNIKVNDRFASDLPDVVGNGAQLQQVFINIIVNAEQAMLEAHGRGSLTITTEQAGNIVRASFTDDGPGISPENIGKLFTPFFTTKEVGKGTGLGLSICHGIVAEHGGRVYAKSELGKGATFIVELPVSQ